MARLPRLHVPGGVYSLVLRGNGGSPIFHSDEDRAVFARLVGRSLAHAEARAHAYCWLTGQVNLAVQTGKEPIERFIRAVAGPYARRIHRQRGHRGHLFGPRYAAVLIEYSQLPALVRHIHWAPVRAGFVSDPIDYPCSSHRAYLGHAKVRWLTTSAVLRLLAHGGGPQRIAYAEFMSRDNPVPWQLGFERGSPDDPRAFGDAKFLEAVARRSARAVLHAPGSLDELIGTAARKLAVSREDILSRSRRRPLALARAVVTFHAVRLEIASLSDVARRLQRHPSTLLASISRHRKARPDLFSRGGYAK
jgi:putative transposase